MSGSFHSCCVIQTGISLLLLELQGAGAADVQRYPQMTHLFVLHFISFIVCVSVGTGISQSICEGQRITLESWFSPTMGAGS